MTVTPEDPKQPDVVLPDGSDGGADIPPGEDALESGTLPGSLIDHPTDGTDSEDRHDPDRRTRADPAEAAG